MTLFFCFCSKIHPARRWRACVLLFRTQFQPAKVMLWATRSSSGIFWNVMLASCGGSAMDLPALLSVWRWQAFVLSAQVNCGSFCVGDESARQKLIFDPTGQLLKWSPLWNFSSLECLSWLALAKWGPREQIGLCEVPAAAECNLTQLFHIRGQENNSRGGGRAKCGQQQLNFVLLARGTRD